MFLASALLIVGLVILTKGADFLVEGGSSLAKRFRISPLVIGLTIVAFGTSAPELVVNITASIKGSTDIAIGNVLGSNIANILLILGVCATIYPLTVKPGTTFKEIPFGLMGALLLGVLANDVIIDKGNADVLSRSDGIVLLSFFVIFLVYTFGISREIPGKDETASLKEEGLFKTIMFIVIGLTGLTLGGNMIVSNATYIAKYFGVSDFLIGVTIIAIGTSLPELAASAVAAYRGKADLAVGNIVGSNIFNVFLVLGASATFKPLPFSPAQNIDILMAILAGMLLFLIMFVGKRLVLERWQGIVFVALYVTYTIFVIFRG